jgi:hypothetical protein
MPCITLNVREPPKPDIYIDSIVTDAQKDGDTYTATPDDDVSVTIVFKNRGDAAGEKSFTITTKTTSGDVIDTKTHSTGTVPAKSGDTDGSVTKTCTWASSSVGNYVICVDLA